MSRSPAPAKLLESPWRTQLDWAMETHATVLYSIKEHSTRLLERSRGLLSYFERKEHDSDCIPSESSAQSLSLPLFGPHDSRFGSTSFLSARSPRPLMSDVNSQIALDSNSSTSVSPSITTSRVHNLRFHLHRRHHFSPGHSQIKRHTHHSTSLRCAALSYPRTSPPLLSTTPPLIPLWVLYCSLY